MAGYRTSEEYQDLWCDRRGKPTSEYLLRSQINELQWDLIELELHNRYVEIKQHYLENGGILLPGVTRKIQHKIRSARDARAEGVMALEWKLSYSEPDVLP